MVAQVERPLATSVKEHIDNCIKHFAYDDALFLAEMNHDQENSDETLLLLSDCYFRTGRLEELFHLLSANPLTHPRIRYIFAACCFELKKHDECVRTLSDTTPNARNYLHPVLAQSSSAPFAYTLLSKLYCKESRTDEALKVAEKAARLNCLHWSSVQEYLYLGGQDPSEVFHPALKQFAPHVTDENQDTGERINLDLLNDEFDDPTATMVEFEDIDDENEEEDDLSPTHSTPVIAAPARTVDAPRKTTRKAVAADTAALSAERRQRIDENETTSTTKRQTIARAAKERTMSTSKSRGTDSKSPKRKAEPKPLGSRNSNSLRSTSSTRPPRVAKVRSTPVATRASSSTTASASKRPESTGGSTPTTGASTTASSSPSSTASEKDVERMANICQRMYSLALVHHNFVNFKLADAENEIALMHPQAQDTSQVTLARARIMLEKGAYKSARMLLETHHKRFPHKDTHALSSLATLLTSRAKDRAESWCAAANSFSLAKQHSQAVQCLERAIKLNPRFVYSYTLLGCELIEMEELEKAGKAFRAALCVRPRDYRAYYGLAMVHQKKEQLNLAQLDIGKAIEINTQNSVLFCALSSILHAKNDIDGALLVIDKALRIDPHSVAAHYHKARYLYDMRDYSASLRVLEKLKERASDEANVYFLLGKVHKRLGDTDKALLNFHWASNMDPRGESMLSDLGEHMEEEGSSST
ncbi:mat-1 [Pristionchus pacificus]|uniref:Cell division cycle protein 27 homolog n=1 Tax=Pristionchus pacificus TaxID=54126 RepID=A0A2A6BM62_PRIPA|nr:mat-1 [Pristionchus pacificus]|eukprot:PDM66999.1 mat-1 [Pristionchus pacificus]